MWTCCNLLLSLRKNLSPSSAPGSYVSSVVTKLVEKRIVDLDIIGDGDLNARLERRNVLRPFFNMALV
jgi:hypothetical protein